MAATQAALHAVGATSSAGTTPGSSAVDLIRQSQQNFARLATEAKAKAEASRARKAEAEVADGEATKRTTKDGSKTAVVARAWTSDDETKANVERVTALYLADGDTATQAKRAA